MAMILLDAEKAFDRVSWQYLWATMVQRGFGPGFITAIQAIYHRPYARLNIMGQESSSIDIARERRQGCPCSPILFALYIDIFIQQILQDQIITPGICNGHESKIMAYADDLAVVTTDPEKAIIQIQKLASEYERKSSYLLNTGKTQILCNSNTLCHDPRKLEEVIYFGIRISSNVDSIWKINMLPMINKISTDLRCLDRLHLSLIGRCNILKMVMLPKVLYMFRSIPLEIEDLFLKKLDGIFSNFVWKYSKIDDPLHF